MSQISINSVNSVSKEIEKLEKEHLKLLEYPVDRLAKIIHDVGFKCSLCGKCCTKEFNDHVFLLTDDLIKAKEKYTEMIVPAPYFEVCDNNGCFYVSGYALKVKQDGDCVFLENNRCRIYEDRFVICRVYPYMLHREKDDSGKTEWRQISGLDEHGEYNTEIPYEMCHKYAQDTIEYENKFLIQELDFHRCLLKHFMENSLKPVRKIYDENMRRFNSGEKIKVFVFNGISFEENIISKDDYILST